MSDGEDNTAGEFTRRRSFTPTLQRPGRQYHILVHTSGIPGGEATGEVAITLYGTGNPPRRTLRHFLRRSVKNLVPFRSGQTDFFIINTTKDIGILSGIRIGLQDAGSTWHLHHVEVWDAFRQQWTFFMCRQWLGTASPGTQSKVVLRPGRNAGPRGMRDGDIHCYKVVVLTSNERGGGFAADAEVDLILLGMESASGPLPLAPAPSPFPMLQRGGADVFYFELPYLGEISRLEVVPKRVGSEGPWHLRHIEVTKIDAGTAPTSFFVFDSIIPAPGRPLGQGLLLRPGPPVAEAPEANSNWKYEVAIYTSPSSSVCPPADVVISLWGQENANGAPATRRLLHPCWKSSWAPVLHHSESCALLAATQKAIPEKGTVTGTKVSSALKALSTNTGSAKALTAPKMASEKMLLPVAVRRSVEPLKRNRSQRAPAKDRPGTKMLTAKTENTPSGMGTRKTNDPFEVLRSYGLLDGMESLFGNSAESRSILSSGLGQDAEKFLSIRNSFCQTWLCTARQQQSGASHPGEETRLGQGAPHTQEEASEGGLYADDEFEALPTYAEESDDYRDDDFEEAGSYTTPGAMAPANMLPQPINTLKLRHPCGSPIRPPVDGEFSPGSLLVFLADAEGLGQLQRIRLEALGRQGEISMDGSKENESVCSKDWRIDRVEIWDRDSENVSTFFAGPKGKVVPWSSPQQEHGSNAGLLLSSGRSVATYDISIHTGDHGVEGQVYVSLQQEGAGSSWESLLVKLGCDRHTFRPGSCERFVVTLPNCGAAPDGVKLVCGEVKCLGGIASWQIDRVVIGRAGAAKRFVYPGPQKPLRVSEEAILELQVDCIAGLPKHGAAYTGPCSYKVSVQTSNVLGAGTRAAVWLVLRGRDDAGQETSSGALRLGSSQSVAMIGQLDSLQDQLHDDLEILREELMSPKGAFERGKRDHFLVESPRYICQVDQVFLWTDGEGMEPSWHCHQVEVKAILPEAAKGQHQPLPVFFPFCSWLCEAMPPGDITKEAMDGPNCGQVQGWATICAGSPAGPLPAASPSSWKYRIEVFTSHLPLAGTDSEVFITLHSAKGESGPHELTRDTLLDASQYNNPTDPDLFEPGQIDVFVLDSVDLGPLSAVTVGHYGTDCNAAWHLDKVVVVDQHPKVKRNCRTPGSSLCQRYCFECDRWLAKVGGAESTKVILNMSRQCPRLSVSLASTGAANRPSASHYATTARHNKREVFTPAWTV